MPDIDVDDQELSMMPKVASETIVGGQLKSAVRTRFDSGICGHPCSRVIGQARLLPTRSSTTKTVSLKEDITT